MTSGQRVGKVTVNHLDRILYPSAGISKEAVILYYIRAAPRLLPFLAGRALVLQRFPEGVGSPGFYAKDAPAGTPSWVTLFSHYSASAKREIRSVVCDSPDTLVWLANLAALELHMPLARTDDPASPDMLFFDLDPEPPAGFAEAVEVALTLREVLMDLGLSAFVKTSGRKGLHVALPVERRYSFGRTRTFVHGVGILLARRMPGVISELSGTHTPGTVFVDYLQNAAGKTMVAPWSLRATPGATVSMPLSWDALEKGVSPEEFTIDNALSGTEDPWEGFFDRAERLPEVKHE